VTDQKRLNTSVVVFILLAIFARGWLIAHGPFFSWAFFLATVFIVWWIAFFAFHRIKTTSEHIAPPHRLLQSGDYFRLFFTLWAGHRALGDSVLGFWVFTACVVFLVCALITIACVEAFLEKKLTILTIGCGFFVYCLLTWERSVFVQHYGVPIIGHFFEKPEYDAQYYLELQPENSNRKVRVVADIRVEGRSEFYESGEDRYGLPIYETDHYRDVWVRRLHFHNGGSVAVKDQSEPMSLYDSALITDAQGRSWYARLINESVN
jgi:hypothetical protein